jgi:hypothetical protein
MMTEATSTTPPTAPVPPAEIPPYWLFRKLIRCPSCRGLRMKCYRTTDSGDGTKTQYRRCLDCGRRVLVCWGDDEDDADVPDFFPNGG